MKFLDTRIPGVVVVRPSPISDDRGVFARTFCAEEFHANGLATAFVQSSTSFNRNRGTLRGLHFQVGEHAEDKLVRCTAGAVFDVAVDLRAGSSTLHAWVGVELTAANRASLFIPKGCAHGFVTLEPASEVLYLMTAVYHPPSARGVRYDDPAFRIEWPDLGELTMSENDRSWPLIEGSSKVGG